MKALIHHRTQIFAIEGRGGTISYFHQARHAEPIHTLPAQAGFRASQSHSSQNICEGKQ
jgi:hypothetical protein